MLLEFYILFMFVSLAGLFVGYYADIDPLKITGFTFIFLLGIVLLGVGGSSGVQYHEGDNITTSGDTITVTPLYSYYTNFTLGFFIAVLGGLGFAITLLDIRRDKKREREEG